MTRLWIYVLESQSNGTRYVGHTDDLQKRLLEHNKGKNQFTKGHRPWKLIYQEPLNSRSKAVQRERFLKTGVGRKELKDLLSKS